jgi:hypothetical protein
MYCRSSLIREMDLFTQALIITNYNINYNDAPAGTVLHVSQNCEVLRHSECVLFKSIHSLVITYVFGMNNVGFILDLFTKALIITNYNINYDAPVATVLHLSQKCKVLRHSKCVLFK